MAGASNEAFTRSVHWGAEVVEVGATVVVVGSTAVVVVGATAVVVVAKVDEVVTATEVEVDGTELLVTTLAGTAADPLVVVAAGSGAEIVRLTSACSRRHPAEFTGTSAGDPGQRSASSLTPSPSASALAPGTTWRAEEPPLGLILTCKVLIPATRGESLSESEPSR